MGGKLEKNNQSTFQNDVRLKRRGILRFGTLISALAGASAVSTSDAQAVETAAAGTYTEPSGFIRQRRQDVTVVTAFQAGHGWVPNGAVAALTNLNDTTDAVFGVQSAKIVTLGANQTATLSSPAMPTIPQDAIIRLWLKYDGPNKLHRIRLWVSDNAAFNSYYQIEVVFSASSVPETSFAWKSGEWVPVTFPWAQASIVGKPNPNALNYLRLHINDRSAGETTVRLGRIEHYLPGSVFSNGVVCLSYDDSFASAYTVARTHLSKYGYTADLFPILDRIDQPGFITSGQIDELAKVHGWSVGAHATTYANHVLGLNGMSGSQRRSELVALRTWCQQNGFASAIYAYPNGAFTKEASADIARYFSVGRTAYRSGSEAQHFNMPTRVQSINAGFQTLSSMKADVDRARANKGVLCIMFHDIVPAKAYANDATVSDHAALIDYIAGQGVAVKSLDEVVRAYA